MQFRFQSNSLLTALAIQSMLLVDSWCPRSFQTSKMFLYDVSGVTQVSLGLFGQQLDLGEVMQTTTGTRIRRAR